LKGWKRNRASEATQEQKIVKANVGLLEPAKRLGNGVPGVPRDGL
jgi:hypothetical protein